MQFYGETLAETDKECNNVTMVWRGSKAVEDPVEGFVKLGGSFEVN